MNETVEILPPSQPTTVEVYTPADTEVVYEEKLLIGPEVVSVSGGSLEVIKAPPVNVEVFGYYSITAPGGGLGVLVVDEVPSGAVNGTNKNFTTASNFVGNSLWVYLNGLRQHRPSDFTILSQNVFQFVQAPLTGDLVIVDYMV